MVFPLPPQFVLLPPVGCAGLAFSAFGLVLLCFMRRPQYSRVTAAARLDLVASRTATFIIIQRFRMRVSLRRTSAICRSASSPCPSTSFQRRLSSMSPKPQSIPQTATPTILVAIEHGANMHAHNSRPPGGSDTRSLCAFALAVAPASSDSHSINPDSTPASFLPVPHRHSASSSSLEQCRARAPRPTSAVTWSCSSGGPDVRAVGMENDDGRL
ncbi:hypothetical protein R3P38DRAFT_1202750 [Favolaschia claudopus]|uniref:Uncharacterized protein n=1 Tax=Favolaschia claudopus TaxID=2862362 RepID=A0AAW0B3X9_9AGAR